MQATRTMQVTPHLASAPFDLRKTETGAPAPTRGTIRMHGTLPVMATRTMPDFCFTENRKWGTTPTGGATVSRQGTRRRI